MNALPFLLAALMPLTLAGQPAARQRPHRASIGIQVSPLLGYRTIGTSTVDQRVVTNRNGLEIPWWGYTASISLSVPVSKRIALESGVGYVSRGYQTRPQALDWPGTVSDLPLSSTTRFGYHFLSIPGKATYTFGTGKLRGIVEAGFSMNVFIDQRVTIITRYAERETESASRKEVGVSRFSLFALIGAGVCYPISSRINVTLAPVFQYGITPLRPGLAVREHLYSGGVTIGLARRF
ncbi:outer membrane beta-barrel protein [Larkinella terrae]|uniref:Outer membrane beta-barrel protein n=1 Tax=Larkinella terrae TaxID=2025311 RepID=A0A7K0EGC6_9BACT|nr:outer membrane beta-barrel protein [Larkinella terrae]MRS60621.1 outer membrane beta-barrel protein [Larkinella terrae]